MGEQQEGVRQEIGVAHALDTDATLRLGYRALQTSKAGRDSLQTPRRGKFGRACRLEEIRKSRSELVERIGCGGPDSEISAREEVEDLVADEQTQRGKFLPQTLDQPNEIAASVN